MDRDFQRRFEILACVFENQDKFSETELAEKFNVSISTFRRDVKALRDLGIDVHSRKGCYSVFVKDDILSSLTAVYLSSITPEQIKNFDLIKCKFRHKTLSIFVEIGKAILDKNYIEIDYFNKGKRIITPISIVNTTKSLHLVAYENGEPKNFAFEWLNNVKMLNKKTKEKNLKLLKDLYKNVWDSYTGGKLYTVRLKFKKEWEEYISGKFWMEGQEIEYEPDGIILKLNVKLSFEFISWVMGWGGEVNIIEPQELKRQLVKRAKEIIEKYV